MILEFSKNFKLLNIEENNWEDNKLKAVVLFFSFFGEIGEVFIATDNIDSEYPNYSMTEISSELADSFNTQLDDEGNWHKIVPKVKEFIKKWEEEQIALSW